MNWLDIRTDKAETVLTLLLARNIVKRILKGGKDRPTRKELDTLMKRLEKLVK